MSHLDSTNIVRAVAVLPPSVLGDIAHDAVTALAKGKTGIVVTISRDNEHDGLYVTLTIGNSGTSVVFKALDGAL